MPQRFPQRRPLLFVGLLLLIVLGTYFIAGAITTIQHWPAISIGLIGESVIGLASVFLLSRLGWWREAGFRIPRLSRALWFFVVPCLLVIINTTFARITFPGLGNVLLFFVLAMWVGFVEETYFRGLILHALLAWGPWQAAIISSVLFGIVHLLNIGAGQNLSVTLVQVVDAMAIGFLFAALALRTQTILPLIIIHGLTDFVGFLALNGTVATQNLSLVAVVGTAVEVLIYITFGFIVMRGVHAPELKPNTRYARGRTLIETEP